ncbi:hypothetical protein FKW77_005710 [Venturia effusa]|uniref:Uncharacterized protein n=1 Tax=Venturia effusa TaxID=50376 RepID=A0A517LK89_9PEZI|nr:hypothetical protein FKW77_005710 [Venturia effusa]
MERPNPTPSTDSTTQPLASLSLTTAAAMKPSPTFLGLARETREEIYKYLLIVDTTSSPKGCLIATTPEERGYLRFGEPSPEPSIYTSILFTNKQIFDESSQILYKNNKLRIRLPGFDLDEDRGNSWAQFAKVSLVIQGLEQGIFRWHERLDCVLNSLKQSTKLAELEIELEFGGFWFSHSRRFDDVQQILERFRKVKVGRSVCFSASLFLENLNSFRIPSLPYRQLRKDEVPSLFSFLEGLEEDMLKKSGKPCMAV